MAKFVAVKKFNALRPVDRNGQEAMSSVHQDREVVVTVKQARNPKQHRLFWKLMEMTHDNLPEEKAAMWPTKEKLAKAIIAYLGYCDMIVLPDGSNRLVINSIAFESMSQDEFDPLFRAATRVCSERIIGVEETEMLMEVRDAAA
tara:strand:+ start:2407 stop:2841 length:435 start_codon:yes stop_codon:yes gene_type:complete